MRYFIVAATIRAAQETFYSLPDEVWKNAKVHYVLNARLIRGMTITPEDIVLYSHDYIFNPEFADIERSLMAAGWVGERD